MENYIKGETLGEGTFGIVFKATHKQTGQIVAIKKIRLGKVKEGINVTALREIKLLKELHSEYIIKLIDVFPHKRNLSLVFEYAESDLEVLIKDRSVHLRPADIKSLMQMVLEGLAFCHEHWVLHRDVKPNNFLISSSGVVKLADFGLARIFGSPDRKYTNQVFARWYRAPELLYGSSVYGPGVDMWAVGCVFAELLLRRPWFPGSSDIDQLGKVFQALGTPSEAQWARLKDLPQYVEFHRTPAPPLRSIFRQAPEDALDLLARLMAFDPARRISAADALQHRYFRADPLPTPPAELPRSQPRPQQHAPAPTHQPPQQSGAQDTGGTHDMKPPSSRLAELRGANGAGASPGGAAAADSAPKPPHRSGMSTGVNKMSLSTGNFAKRLKALDGSSVPRMQLSTLGEAGAAAGEDSTPNAAGASEPANGSEASNAPPRLGLDTGDLKYLRKRKLDMDEALASMSGEPQS